MSKDTSQKKSPPGEGKVSDITSSKSKETLQHELDTTRKVLGELLAKVYAVLAAMMLLNIFLSILFIVKFFTSGVRPGHLYLILLTWLLCGVLGPNKGMYKYRTDAHPSNLVCGLFAILAAGSMMMA
jgi:hypothetical protein